MSKVARCKMKVESIRDGYNPQSKSFTARPVYDSNPESENGRFFEATPSGSLDLHVVNIASIDHIEEGDEIYVDISIANKAKKSAPSMDQSGDQDSPGNGE